MLTEKELKQIKDYLALYGKKDSQLNNVGEYTPSSEDYLAIVKNGNNVTVTIEQLENTFLKTFLDDPAFEETWQGAIDTPKLADGAITTEKLADLAVIAQKILDSAVTTAKIAPQAVTTDKIQDGAVTEGKIANYEVTETKLATGAVTSSKIYEGAVTEDKIALGAVTNSKIATGTISGAKFVDNSISGSKIQDNSVPGSKIKDGTIENVDIKDNSLSGEKLIDNSISGSKIATNAIESRHLLDNSIPASKILDGTIEGIDISDGTISGSKIKNNTIESAKIHDDAITTDKIHNRAVTEDKLHDDAVTTAKILDDSVTTAKILNDAVTEDKIHDDAVTADKILNGSVTENKIHDGAVTANKIYDGAVTSTKIANSTITSTNIDDKAITEDKLADGAVTTAKLADGLISEIQNITDATPTTGSVKPVQSGGVKTAIDDVAFSTSEKVKNVGIDNEPTAGSENLVKSGGVAELIDTTHLVNPTEKSLAKATDAMQLKAKLEGITATETKVTETPVVGYYVKGVDGTLGTGGAYVESTLDNAKYVRFLGGLYTSTAYTSGYAFGHYTDPSDPTTWITDLSSVFDTNASALGTREYIVKCPGESTHFRTTSATTSVPELALNFYCYLRMGDTVREEIDNAMETVVEQSTTAKDKLLLIDTYGYYSRNNYSLEADGTISSKSSSNYRCVFTVRAVNKGAVLELAGETTSLRLVRVGISSTEVTPDNFSSLTYEILYSNNVNGVFSEKFIIPYDGWIIYYRYVNDTWVSGPNLYIYNSLYYSNDGAFDISKYKNNKTYTSVSDAISDIPSTLQKGGMEIKYNHLTPASYSLLKTTSVTEIPTGTEVSEDLGLSTGIYTESQLTNIETLPSSIGSSETYYMVVTGETTTYTTWVITKESNETTAYKTYVLRSPEYNTTLQNWDEVASTDDVIELLKTESNKLVACTDYVEATRSIAASGIFGDSGNHGIIYVHEGEKYLITNNYISSNTVRYAFVTRPTFSSGGTVPVIGGTTVYTINASCYHLITIPKNCNYLIFNCPPSYSSNIYRVNNVDNTPKLNSNALISSAGVYEEFDNLYGHKTNYSSGRILDDNGADIAGANYGTSRYIALNGEKYCSCHNIRSVCFYDSGYTFISNTQATGVPIPSNAAFFRYDFRLSNKDDNNVALHLEDKVIIPLDRKIGNKELAKIRYVGDGNNSVFSNRVYDVCPGHRYRLVVKNPDADISGVTYTTSAYTRFAISYNNGTLVGIGMNTYENPLNNSYTFTLPDDAEYLYVSGRCNAGVEMTFVLEDLSSGSDDAINLMNFVLLGHSSLLDLGFSTANTTIRSFLNYECSFANVSKGDYIKIRYQNYKSTKTSVGFTQTLPKEGDSVENVIDLDLSSDSAAETIIRAPYDGFIVLHVRRESSLALYVQKNLEFLTTYSRYSIDAPVTEGKVVNSLETDENYGNLVSATNSGWGYTDFVDVSNYKFLMTLVYSSTRYFNLLPLMPGAVFYDENKLPISTAYRIGYSATYNSGYSLIEVPAQAKYIRCSSNGAKVIYGFNTTDKYLYPSDNVNYTDAEKELVRNSINASEFLYDEISFDNRTLRNYWINGSTGKYGTGSNYKHYLLNISNVKGIRITANSANSTQYAWFTEMDTPTSGGTPPLLDGTVHYVTADTSEDIVVPAGARFLYVYYATSGSYLPSYLGFYTGTDDKDEFDNDFNERRDRQIADLTAIGLTNLNPPLDSDGWELPQTLQQLNALKKSEQLINIRWTPKWNVPSKYDPYYYEAGHTYSTGIPYSSNNDDGSKTIGEETSFHTFMTAINNPYSLIYTECVNSQSQRQNPPQKSGWGKVYTGSSNGYAYYGTVCCGFTSSVENSPLKWNNPVIRNYNRTNGVYVPICPMGTVDFNLLKIGDICDDTAHSFLIYGLHRDSNGEIDQVKIAESTSGYGRGGCRIRTRTREQFISEISTGHTPPYTIFRYIKLWDNTDYEPSEYVPLTARGEQETTVTYNDAICTFAGDKATFRETDLVVINYNLNETQPYEWTKIVVYKDDVLLGEYTLSEAEQTLVDFYLNGGTPEDPHPVTPDPFNAEINQHNHALVLGKTLASGKYKAQMSDDNGNVSDFTYWEVLPNLVTVIANNPDNYTVTVGGIEEIQVVYINGMYYLPTFEEQQSRKFTVHPLSLAQKWAYTYATFGIKFKIKGIYGNITTLPTDLSGAFVPEEDPDDPD